LTRRREPKRYPARTLRIRWLRAAPGSGKKQRAGVTAQRPLHSLPTRTYPMGNPVPTLKIVLILMIVIDLFWFGERVLSILDFSLFDFMPSTLINLVGLASSLLLIVFNVLLIGLLGRLQLKAE
jgi:hypothetical protein